MSASATPKQQQLIEEASALVSRLTGIQLGPKQAAMVQARLSKRMIELRMSPQDYLEHLRRNPDQENTILISLLTTHHTFFFREFAHFEFLADEGLRSVVASVRAQGRRNLRIWSAACSWGHEVYSLSMLMAAHLKEIAPDFTYEILGTDVDPESVAISRNGVYKWDDIKAIPAHYMGDHWARGSAEISAFVKAKKSIKDPCRFDVCNLTELHQEANPPKYDVVFCRNVLIYFNQEQIKTIASQLLRRLEPHGFLFLGISESLMGMDLPLSYGGPSIYVHKNAVTSPAEAKTARSKSPAPHSPPSSAVPAARPVARRPLRLLCVDDSPVILSLLKKIFTAEPGFEVVATAKNGIEAAEMLKKHPTGSPSSIDAVTLDIHMPGQTGLEYLRKNFGPGHPPVIMVSSVSREDSALGLKCLEIGARDFVEKPSLNNLEEKGEELRMKIRCAVLARNGNRGGMIEVAKAFSRPAVILNPERKLRVLLCGLSDRERLQALLREIKGVQPATLVLLHGGETALQGILPGITSACAVKPSVWDGTAPIQGGFHVADLEKCAEAVASLLEKRRTSLLLVGDVTREIAKKISSWLKGSRHQLIIEDRSGFSQSHQGLSSVATESVPLTSFVYTSDVYLSRDI